MPTGDELKLKAQLARDRAPLKLWSARDIAHEFGVTISTVRVWTRKYKDFPDPVAIVSGAQRIYDEGEVRRWFTRYVVTHNPRFGMNRALRAERRTRDAD